MNDIEANKFRSSSPSATKALSPVSTTSRLSNYAATRKKIASISKSVFKTNIDQHPILTLERAVMRGEGVDGFSKSPKRAAIKISETNLEKYLKKQHKINQEATQILKLPKLPFGLHSTYNEEPRFVDEHFVKEESQPERIQELHNLSRKFKLGERIRSKRTHSFNRIDKKEKQAIKIFNMDYGKLVVRVEQDIIDSYEADKDKYIAKHHYVYQTFRDIEDNYNEAMQKKGTVARIVKKDELLRRLYKAPQKRTSDLEKQMTIKYSLLF